MTAACGRGIRIQTLNDGVRAVEVTKINTDFKPISVLSVCRMSAMILASISYRNWMIPPQNLNHPYLKFLILTI